MIASRSTWLSPWALRDESIVRSDPASDVLLPRLVRFSLIGLLGCGVALALGHLIAVNVTGTSQLEIVVRLIGAALRGLGTGFGLLLLLTSVSGGVYVAVRRMTRR